ncbi:hypothetical protein GGI25_002456 [Coemansia spiralis]|uniref:Uncharacterized protein n=2 Tax=Coemansia TaxID=4863 RepID=A0A9W8KYG5_9FUNG|nr:hypothetical protein BX070DRAFT_132606 [Coemansia spiralis]KAJ1995429.1 hypothetical protein EDC05_000981 [Coemansia umbellata]KAJ2624741.1 hypothetical protein GGI26_001157 [Coemansia sp. RSA 1358]KAJ2678284.1 hypothetical protein GGI25_002456 [Coemansia spiralis]
MTDQSLDTAQSIFVPPTTAETVCFFVSLVVNLSSFFLIGYAIWFRAYPPMRAQHVGITVTIGIGGIIFNISNNLVQGMAKYQGVLGVCDFWGAWIIMTFGVGPFLSAVNMRLVLFYRVFVTGNTYSHTNSRLINFTRRFWPLFVLWLPSLISSIVVTALSGPRGTWLLEDHGLRACDFSYGYLYWIYAYFAAQIVLSWILYLRMRNVAKAFNGFRIALWTLVVFSGLLVVNMVINIVKGSNTSWGRIAIAMANMVLINSYLWFILGVPVLGHLFWREQTMRTFMNNLHKDALIAQQTRAFGLESQVYGMSENEIYAHSSYGNGEESYIDNMDHMQKINTNTVQPNFKVPDAVYTAGRGHVL